MGVQGERAACRVGCAPLGLPHNGGRDAVSERGVGVLPPELLNLPWPRWSAVRGYAAPARPGQCVGNHERAPRMSARRPPRKGRRGPAGRRFEGTPPLHSPVNEELEVKGTAERPRGCITVFTDITTMGVQGERAACRVGRAPLGLPHNGGRDAVNERGVGVLPPELLNLPQPCVGRRGGHSLLGCRGWYSVPCDAEDGPCPACFPAGQAPLSLVTQAPLSE